MTATNDRPDPIATLSDGTQVTVGHRVSIHPASDWFMRGERYATVTAIPRRGDRVTLTGDRSGRTFRLHTSLLMGAPDIPTN